MSEICFQRFQLAKFILGDSKFFRKVSEMSNPKPLNQNFYNGLTHARFNFPNFENGQNTVIGVV